MAIQQRRANDRTHGSILALLAVALFCGGLFALSAAADEKESHGNVADKVSGEFGNKVSDILKDPDDYLGKSVTIKDADVDEVISDRAFVLKSGVLGKGKGLLVIGARRFDEAAGLPGGVFQKENDVMVKGVVRMFRPHEIEREIGFSMDVKRRSEFEEKPVIIASEVVLLERK